MASSNIVQVFELYESEKSYHLVFENLNGGVLLE
eukprot:CAMPEP_0114579628 /NCGR_PEP_ID=MMETSP0125-20121206/3963_1 /TAXON_ID=485358 ORGANISM="Aristerostoma sp., Strain ATCC 50986" /NCGR_SAMPLE_ID=MMETSP0125 /ASSEMBLY_ACC=CAM_ASM_000245 /LENGTH=33 /DNA_ID= /DNA_START= /DNA_END= /DNA_ORIENTATION=